ncbi:MAG: hypothetical protein R6X02_07690 [Enhygromyxa sp.]
MAWPRPRCTLVLLAIFAAGCVGGSYGARTRYPSSEPEPPPAPAVSLLSAHLTRYGDELPPLSGDEHGRERLVEGGEHTQDAILLVFSEEVDPLTLDPRAFGILRADGRRVRPVRAVLAPADEGDENRSVTLLGNFGREGAPPVAVHVIGPLFAESGAELRGLDANITGPEQPLRPVLVERLEPNESRCPDAAQLLRSYWSDSLTHVGADDLAGIELRLADGRVVHPIDFDDQAWREDDPPCPEDFSACLGPADDNVLDLCLDTGEAVVHLHFAAGLFSDPSGRPSAAADIPLPPP